MGDRRLLWALAWTLCLLAAGCTEEAVGGDDDDDDDMTLPEGISISLSDVIPVVAALEWSPDDPSVTEAWVEFGRGGVAEFTAPVDLSDGEPYTATLLGMKTATDYDAWVVAETSDGSVTTDVATFGTGSLPTGLPWLELEVDAAASDMASGFLITSMFTGTPAPVILDGDGEIVWWYLEEDDSFQINRARMSRDGKYVYYWSPNVHGLSQPGAGPGANDSGGGAEQKLVRVSLDGTDVQTWDLTEGHHDFLELPDGTLAYLEYDTRQVGVDDVDGDRIMEMDEAGDVVEVYSVWNDFEYVDDDDPGGAGPPEGWTHSNAIRYQASDDSYYVSLRAQDGILKIDRASGELLWALGTGLSDFTDPDGETAAFFNAQHGFEVLDGSLLVFNNGDAEETASRALEVAVDEATFEAEIVWEYAPQPDVFCPTLGDVHRFDSGNTLVLFSTAGQAEEVTPDGEVVWRLSADIGGALGYGVFTNTLYTLD